MEASGISLEAYMSPEDKATVLAIVPDGAEALELERLFAHSNWLLHRACTREAANRFMRQNHTPVVLTVAELPDGGWREVLSDIERLPEPPRLIVMAPQNKRLWGEVLNSGGYDVLETPLDRRELFTVLNFAWRLAQGGRAIGKPGSMLVARA